MCVYIYIYISSARGGIATLGAFDVCADVYVRCMRDVLVGCMCDVCAMMYVRCMCGYRISLDTKGHHMIIKEINA